MDLRHQDEQNRKKGVVTGIRDRSEVESMIQRYLELAHTALKEDKETQAESA